MGEIIDNGATALLAATSFGVAPAKARAGQELALHRHQADAIALLAAVVAAI